MTAANALVCADPTVPTILQISSADGFVGELLKEKFLLGHRSCVWHIKGIVSRDWGQVYWIFSYRSEEFRVTRAYF